MMEQIIEPVDKFLLKKELNKSKFIRYTNNGNNEIYIVSGYDSPNVLRELGRLREVTFRRAGGGTGKSIDLDEFDVGKNCYLQLIVWDPKEKEIVGGYRFIRCNNAALDIDGNFHLATSHLFKFSDKFITDYMPYTIELGRSFVQPLYQPINDPRKGLYSLDNIWDGLGAIIIDNPDIKYFFGKFTMYLNFNQQARDLILFFLQKYFPDKGKLVVAHKPRKLFGDKKELNAVFTGKDYKENFKILVRHVRKLKENIPSLVNVYMNLSPSMLTFDTALNDSFGEVEETGILVTISDIYDVKKERHIDSYKKK
jgi:hypothetical protein